MCAMSGELQANALTQPGELIRQEVQWIVIGANNVTQCDC